MSHGPRKLRRETLAVIESDGRAARTTADTGRKRCDRTTARRTAPRMRPPRKGEGRPTLYRPEYAEQAEKLCKLGALDLARPHS
jgi:hypothetical protein